MCYGRVRGLLLLTLKAAALKLAGDPWYAQIAESRMGLQAGTVPADAAFPQLLPLLSLQQ